MDRPLRQVRFATPADAEFVLACHNQPTVRAVSFSTAPISPAAHAAWFTDQRSSPKCCLGVIEEGPDRVGVVRIDARGDTADVSIALMPEVRGKGLGCEMIRIMARQARATYRRQRVVARIKPGNGASIRAFGKAGFRMNHGESTDNMIVMEYR